MRAFGRLGRAQRVIAALALAGLLAIVPATASADPCDDGPTVVTAGRPLALSGSFRDLRQVVEISASNEEGALREGNIVMAGATWRGTLIFRPADAGPWTFHLVVDGVACVSALTVLVPEGMTAPPHETPTPEELLITRPPAITGDGVKAAAGLATTAVVILSWVVLLAVGIGHVLGLRPLARRPLVAVTRASAFLGVLGVFLVGYAFAWFMASMLRFGTGIPPEEEVVLALGFVVMLVVASVVGLKAARRVGPDQAVPAAAPRIG